MSIDIIQAILKKDHGELRVVDDYHYDNSRKVYDGSKVTLTCRFGELTAKDTDLVVVLGKLASTYQCLEANITKIEKGVPF